MGILDNLFKDNDNSISYKMSDQFKNWAKNAQMTQKEMQDAIQKIAEAGRIRAINKATEVTPPTKDDKKIRGKNTIHGWLKEAWEKDSDKEITKEGKDFVFKLANNQYYASYVNDGHDLKKHYVPGLHIDEERGVLYFDENEEGGIYVGTKTSRIEPLYMIEQAEEEWEKFIDKEIDKLIGE